jgi:hypothetical protein
MPFNKITRAHNYMGAPSGMILSYYDTLAGIPIGIAEIGKTYKIDIKLYFPNNKHTFSFYDGDFRSSDNLITTIEAATVNSWRNYTFTYTPKFGEISEEGIPPGSLTIRRNTDWINIMDEEEALDYSFNTVDVVWDGTDISGGLILGNSKRVNLNDIILQTDDGFDDVVLISDIDNKLQVENTISATALGPSGIENVYYIENVDIPGDKRNRINTGLIGRWSYRDIIGTLPSPFPWIPEFPIYGDREYYFSSVFGQDDLQSNLYLNEDRDPEFLLSDYMDEERVYGYTESTNNFNFKDISTHTYIKEVAEDLLGVSSHFPRGGVPRGGVSPLIPLSPLFRPRFFSPPSPNVKIPLKKTVSIGTIDDSYSTPISAIFISATYSNEDHSMIVVDSIESPSTGVINSGLTGGAGLSYSLNGIDLLGYQDPYSEIPGENGIPAGSTSAVWLDDHLRSISVGNGIILKSDITGKDWTLCENILVPGPTAGGVLDGTAIPIDYEFFLLNEVSIAFGDNFDKETNQDDIISYAVGLNGLILKGENYGATWSVISGGTYSTGLTYSINIIDDEGDELDLSNFNLNSVKLVPNENGLGERIVYIVGDNDLILISEDDGSTWRLETTGSGADLYDVDAVKERPGEVFVVGNGVAVKHLDFAKNSGDAYIRDFFVTNIDGDPYSSYWKNGEFLEISSKNDEITRKINVSRDDLFITDDASEALSYKAIRSDNGDGVTVNFDVNRVSNYDENHFTVVPELSKRKSDSNSFGDEGYFGEYIPLSDEEKLKSLHLIRSTSEAIADKRPWLDGFIPRFASAANKNVEE